MPIILANSHSHEFSYTDESGAERRVRVTRGQALPEGIPVEVIAELVSETVVSFNGETPLPRYTNVKAAPGEERSYSTGVVSTQKQATDLNTQGAVEKGPDADAVAKALAAAEAELAAESQRAIDAEAAELAAEQHAAEVAAPAVVEETVAEPVAEVVVDVREALIAELADLGVKVHPATGEAKLRARLDEAKAAE